MPWDVVDPGSAYPFLWFFLAWLCWDEFFDSGASVSGGHNGGIQSTYWPLRRM